MFRPTKALSRFFINLIKMVQGFCFLYYFPRYVLDMSSLLCPNSSEIIRQAV